MIDKIKVAKPAIVLLQNNNNKNTNKMLLKFDNVHLLNFEYQLDFISRLFFVSLPFNKYPGVHIIKNANGIDKITFQGDIPNVVERKYFA